MSGKTAIGALVIASTLLAAGGLELGLRLVQPRPEFPLKDFYKVDRELGYDIAPRFSAAESKHPVLGKFSLFSNEFGCYDEPSSKSRVLWVGDSFAQGSHALEASLGGKLQESLGERVLKCGVTGFGTRQARIKAERVLSTVKTAPSLVVLAYFMNDLEDDYLAPARTVLRGWVYTTKTMSDAQTGAILERDLETVEQELDAYERIGEAVICPPGSAAQRARCWMYLNSALYRKVKDPIKRILVAAAGKQAPGTVDSQPAIAWMPRESHPWLDGAWKDHLENISDFDARMKRRGLKFLVVMIPTKEQITPALANKPGSPDYGDGDLDQPNKILRAYMKSKGVAFFDLLEPLRASGKSDLYFSKDFHFSPAGEALAGKLIAQRIRYKRLLPQ